MSLPSVWYLMHLRADNGPTGPDGYGDNGDDRLISLEATNATYLFGGNAKDDLQGTAATIMDGGNGGDTLTVVS